MPLLTIADIATSWWIDFDDSAETTIVDGLFSACNDKSSSNFDLSQETPANRPAVSTLNGKTIAIGDGVNDFLGISGSGVPITTDMAVVMVLIRPTNGASLPVGATGVAYPYPLFWYPNNSIYSALGSSYLNFGTSTSTGNFIMSSVRTASTSYVRKNGAVFGTPGTPPAVGSTTLTYVLRGNSSYSIGGIGEIVVCASNDVELAEGILAWDWGLESSLAADHPYKNSAPTSSMVAILDQPYNLQNYFARAILEQPYTMFMRMAALLDQIYGLKLLVTFNQFYGDAAQLRGNLNQYYGDAAKVRRHIEQKYGNTPKYRAAIDQVFHLYQGLRQQCHQDYSIAEGQIRAALDQLNDLQDKDLLRVTMDMLYVLAAGEALVQRINISTKCAGVEHTSIANINIEQDDKTFYWSAEYLLYDQAEFLQYKKFESPVDIIVDGWEINLLSGIPRESRQPWMTSYVVPLTSKTILLDAPHSRLDAAELSGMASQIVATLAAPFALSWSLVDWFIPPGRLTVNAGDSAISVIRRITEAVGGIIQTAPDGTLICRPEYPVSVDKWPTATPAYNLTDQDDFFQIDHNPEIRDGYNQYLVSDQQLGSTGLTIETETISATQTEVRVFQVPFDATKNVVLYHSGDQARVSITAEGVVEKTITTERVEIIGGSGRTSKPFYSLESSYYNAVDLGAVTIAEDGTVTTAVAENSLLYLTYRTRYYKFLANDAKIEDVQFFPEALPL